MNFLVTQFGSNRLFKMFEENSFYAVSLTSLVSFHRSARGLRNTTWLESHTSLDGVIMPRSDWRSSWNTEGWKRGRARGWRRW